MHAPTQVEHALIWAGSIWGFSDALHGFVFRHEGGLWGVVVNLPMILFCFGIPVHQLWRARRAHRQDHLLRMMRQYGRRDDDGWS
jgi:hypothetical protein